MTEFILENLLIGVLHFVFVGVLYGNPLIDQLYQKAQRSNPGVRTWKNKRHYLLLQFLGTQVEVTLLQLAVVIFSLQNLSLSSLEAVTAFATLTAIRVYPRFWNMWIQSTYNRLLLGVEVINGVLSSVFILALAHFLAS